MVWWLTTTAAVVGAVGGLVGAVGGTVGTIYSVRAQRAANRTAAHVAAVEGEREHRNLSPSPEPEMLELERDSGALYATIRLPRTYRLRAWAIVGDRQTQLDVPPWLAGNVPCRFRVESRRDRQPLRAEYLLVHFWPPADEWTCPCDRPTADGGKPHWVWRVPVTEKPAPFAL